MPYRRLRLPHDLRHVGELQDHPLHLLHEAEADRIRAMSAGPLEDTVSPLREDTEPRG